MWKFLGENEAAYVDKNLKYWQMHFSYNSVVKMWKKEYYFVHYKAI